MMLTWYIERAWNSPLISSYGNVKFHGFCNLLEREENHEEVLAGSDSLGATTINKTIYLFIHCLMFMISAAFSAFLDRQEISHQIFHKLRNCHFDAILVRGQSAD